MKVPNWLYFIVVSAGMGGLALFLTLLFLFLFVSAYHGLASSDVDLMFLISLVYVPSFISLPPGYVLVSRRIKSSSQRRLLNGITVTLIGAITLLAGAALAFSGIGFSSLFEVFFGLPAIFLGFGVMLVGFTLVLSDKTSTGAIRAVPAQLERHDPTQKELRGYLPAAGVATLIATTMTALITVFTLLTAFNPCYSSPTACNPTSLITFGILSTLGIATGAVATSTLLTGRYRPIVPFGIISLTISPLLIFFVWGDLILLAIPILTLCAVSLVLTGWNQKDSLNASAWGAISVLAASLGAIAFVAGNLQFSLDSSTTCLGVWIRPHLNNAEFLLSLGALCVIVALIGVDSARMVHNKPVVFPPSKRKSERSKSFEGLLILLIISLVSTTLLAGYVGGYLGQCRGFCYTQVEQLEISQATLGPTSNQVTLTLANSGASDITITQVAAQGGRINTPTSASQLSTSLVCAGKSNLLLIATFQGVTFTKGTTYELRVYSANGHIFPYTFTA